MNGHTWLLEQAQRQDEIGWLARWYAWMSWPDGSADLDMVNRRLRILISIPVLRDRVSRAIELVNAEMTHQEWESSPWGKFLRSTR